MSSSSKPPHPLQDFLPTYGEPAAPSYSLEGLEPLSYTADPNGDGKQVYNPPRPDGKRSPWYDEIWHGDKKGPSVWDFHVYHNPNNPVHTAYARKLYEAVRREFPELRAYRFFEGPLGPHPVAMFEVNAFTAEQLGAALSWFVANRGPCSVLIHPNTGDDVLDHTVNATWLGEKIPLDVDVLRAATAKSQAAAKA